MNSYRAMEKEFHSTHCPEQADKAVDDGADYIGVGPIFKTETKENVCAPVGFDYLNYIYEEYTQ